MRNINPSDSEATMHTRMIHRFFQPIFNNSSSKTTQMKKGRNPVNSLT
jgi:hypothetical protein